MDIIEFYASKWIKIEYNNARTPQQNGAESVSTACYALNMRSEAKNRDEKLNGDTGLKITKEPVDQEDHVFLEELKSLKRQANEADDATETLRKTFAISIEDLLLQAGAARANSTNNVNTTSTPLNTANTLVNTTSLSRNVSAAGPSYPDLSSYANQDDSQIPSLEDIYEVPNDGIFINASYNYEGVVADFTNLKYTVNIEPKKISQALEDKSWVDAIQEDGIDYDEVFAPVARIEAIRIFLAFASYIGFIVYQIDVKSAFLHGKINEEVYVSQPPGFIDPKFPKKVKQREDGIFISQDKYVTEILKKFDFISVKTASTLTETKQPLVKDAEAADVDVHLYRSMIGYLIYLTASRHDIMYVVCDCFRFQVTSKTLHLHAMKRIFRYLKGQPKLGLWYPRESAFDLEAYSDSNHAGENLDKKSTTEGCQFLGRRLILLQCKKQITIANSTTEA
nr:putative ribonuclease H-like domain-containing protein [Tanacetum cinerariifolium]